VRQSLSVDAGRLRSPAGLDIGARTPDQVALAIVAEVVATRSEAPQKTENTEQKAEVAHHCHHHG
jgi:xanthine/CO dehydrogenase XdhC/CoxF family maturation factor